MTAKQEWREQWKRERILAKYPAEDQIFAEIFCKALVSFYNIDGYGDVGETAREWGWYRFWRGMSNLFRRIGLNHSGQAHVYLPVSTFQGWILYIDANFTYSTVTIGNQAGYTYSHHAGYADHYDAAMPRARDRYGDVHRISLTNNTLCRRLNWQSAGPMTSTDEPSTCPQCMRGGGLSSGWRSTTTPGQIYYNYTWEDDVVTSMADGIAESIDAQLVEDLSVGIGISDTDE